MAGYLEQKLDEIFADWTPNDIRHFGLRALYRTLADPRLAALTRPARRPQKKKKEAPVRHQCRKCNQWKDASDFYPGDPGICRGCRRRMSRVGYWLEAHPPELADFTCRDCGRVFPGEERSKGGTRLCRGCYRAELLRRKAEAPEVLTCRHCRQEKPKAEFEKYSITRCRACAILATRKYRKGKS